MEFFFALMPGSVGNFFPSASARAARFFSKTRPCFAARCVYGSPDVNKAAELIANPDVVVTDLRATTGEEAMRELHARLAAVPGAVTDAPQFLAELLERAQVSSVCIADDVALPHARTAAVTRLALAVGRATADIAFDAEHPRVRLVFLIGTPKGAVTEYLKLVAALSRLLKNAEARAALLTAPDEAALRAVLSQRVKR